MDIHVAMHAKLRNESRQYAKESPLVEVPHPDQLMKPVHAMRRPFPSRFTTKSPCDVSNFTRNTSGTTTFVSGFRQATATKTKREQRTKSAPANYRRRGDLQAINALKL